MYGVNQSTSDLVIAVSNDLKVIEANAHLQRTALARVKSTPDPASVDQPGSRRVSSTSAAKGLQTHQHLAPVFAIRSASMDA